MNAGGQALKPPVGGKEAGPDETAARVVITDTSARKRLKLAAAALAIFGLALFGASYARGPGDVESLLLVIGGITAFMLAVLFYYLSPSRFLRSDVSDAMCLTCAEFMYRTLMPHISVSRCTYVPAAMSGDGRTLLLVAGGVGRDAASGAARVSVHGHGFGDGDMFVVPPGYGLMEHAKRLGAVFTGENLEDEIKDVLVNGFDLAGRVKVESHGDSLSVEMRGVASSAMCNMLRQKNAGICGQIGCPLCSFVACMVAEGTGRRVLLDKASVRWKTIRLTLRMV